MTDKPARLPRARTPEARMAKLVKAGTEIARLLRDDPGMHQEHAAILAGLSEWSYYHYLSGEDEAALEFQRLVKPAIFEQAKRNLEQAERDIACVEGGSSAYVTWNRWKLEKRYRKIFGDLAQKTQVELTGKDGGAIALTARPPTRAEALAELRQLMQDPEVRQALTADPGVAGLLAGGEEGEDVE